MFLMDTLLSLLLCLLFVVYIHADDVRDEYKCGYYIADSKIPGFGRGVFAGQAIQANDTMFESSTVLVRNWLAMDTMLAFYVFTDDNDDHEILMFGPMLMLNHMDTETVDYAFADYPVTPPRQILHTAHTTHTSFLAISLENISQGTELFTNYGKQWFKDRRIKRANPPRNASNTYTPEELERDGRCLTDVFVADSSLPLAGKGVFANKPFLAGEVVSVSPMLVLPRHALEQEAEYSVLINYCITAPEEAGVSDVALAPLSQAGMMNHGAGDMANVEMDWFEWAGEKEEGRLASWTAKQLEEAPFAPLDLKFVATRDIAEGEELLLFYGLAWERAWIAHLDAMLQWHEMQALMQYFGQNDKTGTIEESVPPQFRAPIAAPLGLFPESFFVDECLGPIPCDEGSMGGGEIKHDAEEMAEVMQAQQYAFKHFSAAALEVSESEGVEGEVDVADIEERSVKEEL